MSGDGRMFGWQRTRGGARGYLMAVIVWDERHGSSNFEFVGGLHTLKPYQYDMTLSELEEVYPAPAVQPDHKET